MEATAIHTDLPLISNVKDIRARHYLLEFQTDVVSHVIYCQAVIFFDISSPCEVKGEFCTSNCSCLQPNDNQLYSSGNTEFPIILECNDLTFENVFEIKCQQDTVKKFLSPQSLRDRKEEFTNWNMNKKEELTFIQDNWSIKIYYKESGLFKLEDFPKVICIIYKTNPNGGSIYWRNSVKEGLSAFTSGALINNRSLIPAQDRPCAMATWQAWFTLPEDFYISMTGDKDPLVLDSSTQNTNFHGKQMKCFYYYTNMVLPVSTIAIAIGKWEVEVVISQKEASDYNKTISRTSLMPESTTNFCNHVIYPCHISRNNARGPLIPVTLVASSNFALKTKKIMQFVKYILIACSKLFGVYPFQRLEIVILPRCYPHLGLASPNLIYLSKSVIIDDSSFYLRMAHEISHSWYGITIGPKNWEEEWLSEGFATYLEDSIYVIALEECQKEEKIPNSDIQSLSYDDKFKDFFNLRAHIRYKALVSEAENCSQDLQVLSPDNLASTCDESVIVNGLNANKPFIQIHYLKGYFLLNYICSLVSRRSLDKFLGIAACKFHGQLISSKDFLVYLYEYFPYLESFITLTKLESDWLRSSQVNPEINSSRVMEKTNTLIQNTIEHLNYWTQYNCSKKNLKSRLSTLISSHKFIYSDQIVLLFEHILKSDTIKSDTLKSIKSFYKVEYRNVDIIHRWCELVVKFNYPDLIDVENFLIENQAMGVYLYGELVISGKAKHRKLAEDVYHFLEDELCSNTKTVISEMLFPK